MVVGVLFVEIHIPASTNLKAKRRVLQSIKANVRNKFNVSISEVDFHDLWQRCAFGVAGVGPDRLPVERELDSILRMIEGNPEGEVTNHNMEFV